jgi:uncharacterized protein (DUF2267 family)
MPRYRTQNRRRRYLARCRPRPHHLRFRHHFAPDPRWGAGREIRRVPGQRPRPGEYASHEEAADVTRITLARLGERLTGGQAQDLAAQLPAELQPALLQAAATPATSSGIHEFLRRLAGDLNATEETARSDASAVVTTLAEAITGGQLNQILSQLPAGFAQYCSANPNSPNHWPGRGSGHAGVGFPS